MGKENQSDHTQSKETRLKQTILVVDDNEANRHLLEKLLLAWGMKPVLAAEGMKGIEEYQTSVERGAAYPLVLLDVNMPWIDGYEVAAKMREIAPAEEDRKSVV